MIATTVSTKFVAVDGYSKVVSGMERVTAKANKSIARQESLFKAVTPNISNAAKQILSYASAGAVLGAAAFSGKAIMDYETAIQSLSAVTGVSGAQLDVFKAEIKDVATTTKKSATDVAGSFEVIGSMMSQYLTDPKALRQISEAGITLAKASRQELVPTLENLTSIMNQFDLQANQATDTINRLTAGEIVGSLRTSQVAEALQEFGAGAYAANVTLSESVALTEALAKQLKTDKIGVGARNILTVLDSAKGLDKRARRDLRRSGVDMTVLMDKTKTLSQRLRELSKISGNATVVTSVFGKENKTAAQVIFNQLDTYDAYLAKIKTTNEAQNQAKTNSETLAVKVDQLKNTWINYIATNDKAAVGLDKLKNGVSFLAENMDTIVSVGVDILKFMALWKGAIIAQKIVTGALTAATVIANATSSAFFLVDMVKYVATTQGLTTAQAALAIVSAELNAIWLANPIGVVVLGVAALAAGIYLLTNNYKQLLAEYERGINKRVTESMNQEATTVDLLIGRYQRLGMSMNNATAAAIKFEQTNIALDRIKLDKEIADLQNQVRDKQIDLGIYGGRVNLPGASELQDKLIAKQQQRTKNMSESLALTNFAIGKTQQGTLSKEDSNKFFAIDKSKQNANGNEDKFFAYEKANQDQNTTNEFSNTFLKESNSFDYRRMGEEIAKALKSTGKDSIDVNISGLPAGTNVQTKSNKINTGSSY